MRSILVALLAAPLLLSPAMARHSHDGGGEAGHRVSFRPGYAVTIPAGWASCDPDMNVALGNSARVPMIDKVCAENPRSPGDQLFVSLNNATPMLFFTHHEDKVRFPSDFLAEAPPDVLQGMAKKMCGAGERALRSCVVRSARLEGNPVFEGDAVMGDPPIAVTFYIQARRSGASMLFFFVPTRFRAAAEPVMQQIVASVHVPPDAPPPSGTAVLTPAPGMTMTVPRSWIACDAANDALLGNAPDPFDIRTSGCTAGTVGSGELRVIGMDGSNVEFVLVSPKDDAIDKERFEATLSDAALAKTRDVDCGNLAQAVTAKDQATISDCMTAAGEVAGHAAKVVSFAATETDAETGLAVHVHVRALMFPYSGKLMYIAMGGSGFLGGEITDATQAIVSSIAMQ